MVKYLRDRNVSELARESQLSPLRTLSSAGNVKASAGVRQYSSATTGSTTEGSLSPRVRARGRQAGVSRRPGVNGAAAAPSEPV